MPVVEVPASFGAASMALFAREAREMVEKATMGAPESILRILDAISERFLLRTDNRHLQEIREVSTLLGRSGAFFLNANYEWGCSVRLFDTKSGPQMARVLDWSTPGLGARVKVFKVESAFGPWYTPSWPGFAGIVHGLAPGRFAVAINQAPLRNTCGFFIPDWAMEKTRVWHSRGMLPAHVLRKVMEEAADYAEACTIMQDTPVCAPAIFSIVGTKHGEHRIIERAREGARVSPVSHATNHFICLADGHHRGANSVARSAAIARRNDMESDDFTWLEPPTLNGCTVLAFVANPREGTLRVCGIDDYERVTYTLTVQH